MSQVRSFGREQLEPSSPQPLAKLERIGRYRIVRPLSKGGMAMVYEARRESLAGVSPRVAIKVILPEHNESDTFQELFINEARLGASLHHQNLVQIQDFDREGDRFFLVMEYVEGITLRRAITLCSRAGVKVPLGVIAEIGRQACDGLHHAHAATDEQGNHLRLVHRDVKPSNLILNPHGVVKLLDFGISKGRLMRERRGAVKGTWGYMSPEQAFGREVGPQADVFGLGTSLYELASLGVLFEGKDKARIKRLLVDDHAARMAATLDPGTYGPLVPVLVRALQRDPEARFATAAELGRSLSSLLPDPITARDEVEKFYKMVCALNEGVPVAQAARSADFRSDVSPSQGSLAHSVGRTSHPGMVAPLGIMAAIVLLGGVILVLLAVLFALQAGLLDRQEQGDDQSVADVLGADTPPAPVDDLPEPDADVVTRPAPAPRPAPRAAPRERPPPDQTVPLPKPTTDPAAMPVFEPEPAGTAEVAPRVVVVRKVEPDAEPEPVIDGEPGLLTVGAKQDAEVYVDGTYVRKVPLVRKEYAPGHHVVTIQALDGRRQTFEVDLEPGEESRWVWDFDRGEWRK